MAEQHRVAALRAFVDQLNELHDLAGSPTLSHLRTLSLLVPEDNLRRGLATSTTHDILSGKRKRVPPWAWVACFVATCALAAKETGLNVQAMGDTQAWHRRWRAAQDARPPDPPAALPSPAQRLPARHAPLTPPPLTPTPLAPTPTPPPLTPTPLTPPFTRAPGNSAAHPPTAEIEFPPLSPARQRLLQIYGRTGARLLTRSETGDGRRCMHLAVIALLRGCSSEARPELRQARAADHPDVSRLLDHSGRLRADHRQAAADLAYAYGRDYERADPTKPSVAMFFYRLASDHGHAAAAYRLAMIHQDKGEDWAAASLFSRAAGFGHPQAAAKFNGASQQLTQAPWNAAGVMRPTLIEEDEPAMEPPSPAGDPPPEFL
ncbi:hypothetical protein [Streptosporangium vulgare]|uniref:Sel1 repeat family protein n=1 Tax=Streptosporangium vulgare TaxID=46190 RepID=A0ABV5TBT1_9ACTN